jgi:RHS repeat-associated protein
MEGAGVEKTGNGIEKLPFRFTGKEFDEETGLYYYGARYLDPKASRWLTTDPALGDYIPGAPVNEEARKANGNLPGMGGVFNVVNMQLYHYAGNNPVKYIDPDGRAHFGKKPMEIFNNIRMSSMLDDALNTELFHEQLFFDDGSGDNVGFGWTGRFSDNPDNGYRMDDKQYDDDLMRKAVGNVNDGEYSLLGGKVGKALNKILGLFGKHIDEKIIGNGEKNNCQDWADRVRDEYNKLFESLPKEEQEKITASQNEKAQQKTGTTDESK